MFTNATRVVLAIVAAIAMALSITGCATSPQRPEAETVGQLSSIDGSSYRKPVHATTDLAPVALVSSDDVEVR